jgi:hypothetical protein
MDGRMYVNGIIVQLHVRSVQSLPPEYCLQIRLSLLNFEEVANAYYYVI